MGGDVVLLRIGGCAPDGLLVVQFFGISILSGSPLSTKLYTICLPLLRRLLLLAAECLNEVCHDTAERFEASNA